MKSSTLALIIDSDVPTDHRVESEVEVMTEKHISAQESQGLLPALRFEVLEAAQILRMSRAQLYNRIHDGALRHQKDGARTYITRTELERYVEACSR
jgi:excisionase family DNA binding protein